jgi:hypothetical protein
MKRLILTLLVLFTKTAASQEAPSFDGIPFLPATCEIVWAASTNQLPAALRVYKTVPQVFSERTVSNLVALGSFTASNRKEAPEERPTDKYARWFFSEGNDKAPLKYLIISPAGGFVMYRDRSADDIHSVIEDVPREAEVKDLGLKLLDQIGISRSELAVKPNSSELLTYKETRSRGPRYDVAQRKVIGEKRVESRGVFFVRRIDGVNFAGIGVGGGFLVRFTSHAKVVELQLVWRNLQPYKNYRVATPSEIIQWIKEGKAAIPFTDAEKVNPHAIKKLTITKISPLYAGELPEKQQDFTYPFASLDTIADTGETNISVELYCPILSKNTVRL